MSAFILPASHINALVAYATGKGGFLTQFDEQTAAGAMLMRENIASVAYRYQDSADLPGPISTPDPEAYTFSRPARALSAVEAIKAANCYEYQSCEHPGWETSQAKRWIDKLRNVAINNLPGYADAAWEIDG